MSDPVEKVLPGAIGITIVLAFTLMSLMAVLISVSELTGISLAARQVTLQIFCLVTFLAWFCFGVSASPGEYGKQFVTYAMFYGIFAAMIILPFPALFWAGLIAYVAWALHVRFGIGAIDNDVGNTRRSSDDGTGVTERFSGFTVSKPSGWRRAAPYISIAWMSSGIFIFLGGTSIPHLPNYADPLFALTGKRTILDWRLMVTMLFATIFLIRSIVVTKRPTLEKWETYRLEKSRDSGLLTRIFNQLKSVVNALSFVLFLLINLFWKTVVRFGLWLVLVVAGMISEISKSIRDMCFIETILKPGVTFGIVVLLSVAVREFTQPIRAFLANQEGIVFFLDEKNWILFELFILFILSLFAILFLAWIWKGLDDELTEKAIVSALVIGVIWAFVSFLTWMLAPLNAFGLKSYRPGIYLAAVITSLVIAVAILGITKFVGFILFKSNKSGPR